MTGEDDDMTTELEISELGGALRELLRRVVALEIRDKRDELIANAEGEFGHLEPVPGGGWFFRLGGDPPPERDGIEFIVASHIDVRIDTDRVLAVHDLSTGIGVSVVLRVRLDDGVSITVWPAMPLQEQWTERHEENR